MRVLQPRSYQVFILACDLPKFSRANSLHFWSFAFKSVTCSSKFGVVCSCRHWLFRTDRAPPHSMAKHQLKRREAQTLLNCIPCTKQEVRQIGVPCVSVGMTKFLEHAFERLMVALKSSLALWLIGSCQDLFDSIHSQEFLEGS